MFWFGALQITMQLKWRCADHVPAAPRLNPWSCIVPGDEEQTSPVWGQVGCVTFSIFSQWNQWRRRSPSPRPLTEILLCVSLQQPLTQFITLLWSFYSTERQSGASPRQSISDEQKSKVMRFSSKVKEEFHLRGCRFRATFLLPRFVLS